MDSEYVVSLVIRLGVLELVEISEYLVSGCLEGLWIIDFLVE